MLRFLGPEWPKNKLGDLRVGFRPYSEAGSTALATIPLETFQPTFWFSDAEACQQIAEDLDRFTKEAGAVSAQTSCPFLATLMERGRISTN